MGAIRSQYTVVRTIDAPVWAASVRFVSRESSQRKDGSSWKPTSIRSALVDAAGTANASSPSTMRTARNRVMGPTIARSLPGHPRPKRNAYRTQPGFYEAARTASTSSACVFGSTFRITLATVPSAPITNVERSTPMYCLPAKLFCFQTSYASETA